MDEGKKIDLRCTENENNGSSGRNDEQKKKQLKRLAEKKQLEKVIEQREMERSHLHRMLQNYKEPRYSPQSSPSSHSSQSSIASLSKVKYRHQAPPSPVLFSTPTSSRDPHSHQPVKRSKLSQGVSSSNFLNEEGGKFVVGSPLVPTKHTLASDSSKDASSLFETSKEGGITPAEEGGEMEDAQGTPSKDHGGGENENNTDTHTEDDTQQKDKRKDAQSSLEGLAQLSEIVTMISSKDGDKSSDKLTVHKRKRAQSPVWAPSSPTRNTKKRRRKRTKDTVSRFDLTVFFNSSIFIEDDYLDRSLYATMSRIINPLQALIAKELTQNNNFLQDDLDLGKPTRQIKLSSSTTPPRKPTLTAAEIESQMNNPQADVKTLWEEQKKEFVRLRKWWHERWIARVNRFRPRLEKLRDMCSKAATPPVTHFRSETDQSHNGHGHEITSFDLDDSEYVDKSNILAP